MNELMNVIDKDIYSVSYQYGRLKIYNVKHLTLLRGIAGSGKTHYLIKLIELIKDKKVVVCCDDLHLTPYKNLSIDIYVNTIPTDIPTGTLVILDNVFDFEFLIRSRQRELSCIMTCQCEKRLPKKIKDLWNI